MGNIPGDEQLIDGTGEIVFNFSEDFFDGLHDYNSHVTVGPGITIRTGSSDGRIRMENFLNRGTISAETAGKRLIVQYNPTSTYFAMPWRNEGLLRARNGGTLSLFGEIPVGGLGNFDSTGGVVGIGQKLFNTNNTLQLDSPARVLTLEGNGQIIGGEVAISNGGALQLLPSGSGALVGVRINGDLSLPTNSDLQVTSGCGARHPYDRRRGSPGDWRDGGTECRI